MSKKLKTYIVICFLILILGFLFGCKGKKEYEKPKWVERWDSVMAEAKPFLDSVDTIRITGYSTFWDNVDTISYTVDSHPFDGGFASTDYFIQRNNPKKKSNDVGMSTKPSGYGKLIISKSSVTEAQPGTHPPLIGKLRYAPFVGDPIDVHEILAEKTRKKYDKWGDYPDTSYFELYGDSLLKFMADSIATLPIHWTSDSTRAYFLLEDMQADYFSISDSIETVAIRDNKTGKWEIVDCERALEVIYMLDSIKNANYQVEYKLKTKNKK